MHSSYSNHIRLQEKLERRIIDGLLSEWQQAAYILKPELRNRMKKPFITIRDMNSKLAAWNGSKREIAFSRDFVMNHPWDSVREVLVHEMAHQLTEEGFGVRDETPHGLSFQRACYFLRANPEASGAYPTIHQRLSGSDGGSDDKILLKIRKLMALSESRNQFEAEAAMVKAHELIEKYNIDLMKQEKNRNYISIFIGKPALRHFSDDYKLSHILEDFYFVSCIWASAYVLEKEKMGRVLEISGAIHNVRISAYVYDFVRRFIDVHWAEYRNGKRLAQRRKTDFAIGVINGFRSKLENQAKARHDLSESKSLVKAGDPQLKSYVRYRYPHLHTFRRGSGQIDPTVFSDGADIGKTLVISKGIAESGGHVRQLLE